MNENVDILISMIKIKNWCLSQVCDHCPMLDTVCVFRAKQTPDNWPVDFVSRQMNRGRNGNV